MNFTPRMKKKTIEYRICDEIRCQSIALRMITDASGKERQLCEYHNRALNEELKIAEEQNAKRAAAKAGS